jgi:hypothetical protein
MSRHPCFLGYSSTVGDHPGNNLAGLSRSVVGVGPELLGIEEWRTNAIYRAILAGYDGI